MINLIVHDYLSALYHCSSFDTCTILLLPRSSDKTLLDMQNALALLVSLRERLYTTLSGLATSAL